MRGLPTRLVLAGLLVATLLLAGVVSFYASSDPDGLNRVAEDEGFASTESDHTSADGPLSDYEVAGVDDERLSGGLAGVAGVVVVLLLTGGIAYAVRRRPGTGSDTGTRTEGDPRTSADDPADAEVR
jgi:cobalt/nickel transport protein